MSHCLHAQLHSLYTWMDQPCTHTYVPKQLLAFPQDKSQGQFVRDDIPFMKLYDINCT